MREVTPADCVLARKDADGASELWNFPVGKLGVSLALLLTFALLPARDDGDSLKSGFKPSARIK